MVASSTLGRAARALVSRCSSFISRVRSAWLAAASPAAPSAASGTARTADSLSDSASCACITSMASNSCWTWPGRISTPRRPAAAAACCGRPAWRRGLLRRRRRARPASSDAPTTRAAPETSQALHCHRQLPTSRQFLLEQPHSSSCSASVRWSAARSAVARRRGDARLLRRFDIERPDGSLDERPGRLRRELGVRIRGIRLIAGGRSYRRHARGTSAGLRGTAVISADHEQPQRRQRREHRPAQPERPARRAAAPRRWRRARAREKWSQKSGDGSGTSTLARLAQRRREPRRPRSGTPRTRRGAPCAPSSRARLRRRRRARRVVRCVMARSPGSSSDWPARGRNSPSPRRPSCRGCRRSPGATARDRCAGSAWRAACREARAIARRTAAARSSRSSPARGSSVARVDELVAVRAARSSASSRCTRFRQTLTAMR